MEVKNNVAPETIQAALAVLGVFQNPWCTFTLTAAGAAGITILNLVFVFVCLYYTGDFVILQLLKELVIKCICNINYNIVFLVLIFWEYLLLSSPFKPDY
jgi:hypothetical protein